MPNLTEVRDAAVLLLRTVHPDLRVDAFEGELSVDLAADKAFAPGVSVLVAALAADNEARPGSLDLDMTGVFCAVVVASNLHSPEEAQEEALPVAERIVMAIHGATFGLPLSPAIVSGLEAAPDEDLARSGIRIWVVYWRQSLMFTNGG